MPLKFFETTRTPGLDLNFDEIQGDILVGLQKKAENFVFFSILDAEDFKNRLGENVDANITSCTTAKNREIFIRTLREQGDKTTVLPLWGFNIGFTHQGIEKITGQSVPSAVKEDGVSGNDAVAFQEGAHARTSLLGDKLDDWTGDEFRTGAFDGIMLLAGPESGMALMAETSRVLDLFGSSISVVFEVCGEVRSDQSGHEHFGFLDGVSQPGIRDLTLKNPQDPNQGNPGQDLLWPGEFVFGYPGQGRDDVVEKGPLRAAPLSWMKNGSYMVWRQLEQQVLKFHSLMKDQAAALSMSPELLAARVVGRWPSGAPVLLSPQSDDPQLGDDPKRNNDFEYFRDDPMQKKCPYAAHIRKTYPRDDLTSPEIKSAEALVQQSRIMRAGIPYGPKLNEDEEAVGNEKPRGLLFVCYQTSIEDQFEFIQSSWANNENFVPFKHRPDDAAGANQLIPGVDLIIGQVDNRFFDEPLPSYPPASRLTSIPPVVTSRGAGYFFMPSISAMRNLFAET